MSDDGPCPHDTIICDAIDQTWGVICCDCEEVLAAEWMGEKVPDELRARAEAERGWHRCGRVDCASNMADVEWPSIPEDD